jgi:hypothetical protein
MSERAYIAAMIAFGVVVPLFGTLYATWMLVR